MWTGLLATAERVDSICSRCGAHFRSTLDNIANSNPAVIERAVYDVHAQASGEAAGDQYHPPDFAQVQSHYRLALARSALRAENWGELASVIGEFTRPGMSATFSSPDSAI